MSDVLSKVYRDGDEVHGLYASKHVKLSNNMYDTLDKEIDYIEKTLSDHYNDISNNTIFMNTTRSLLVSHSSDKDNPHNTTKAQVGLGNCDNTADNVKEVKSATKLAVPRKIGNATFDGTKNISVEEIGYDKKALMADVISMIYPVGSVKITFTNINPSTTLSGTTWTLISQGKYIRGVDPNNTSLNTTKTGGSNTIDVSHTHSIAAHTHTLNHTHTIAAHTHTIGHSHSVPGHAHTVNSHAHSTSGVTLSTTHMPSHGGHVAPWRSSRGQFGEAGRNGVYILTGQTGQGQRSGDWEVTAFDIYFGNEVVPRCEIYGGDASHAHGNTGASAPATNSVSLTTASGGGNSGGTSLTTASGGGTTTGTALTTSNWNSTKTIEPEYQTLYFWRRTA